MKFANRRLLGKRDEIGIHPVSRRFPVFLVRPEAESVLVIAKLLRRRAFQVVAARNVDFHRFELVRPLDHNRQVFDQRDELVFKALGVFKGLELVWQIFISWIRLTDWLLLVKCSVG